MSKLVRTADEAKQAMTNADWGSLNWLGSPDIGNIDNLTLGRVVIKPGECNPRHMHTTCSEVLYLMSGKLKHTIGDDEYILEPGDTITVPAGVYHNAVSVGEEDADMIVAFNSGDRDFVKEE